MLIVDWTQIHETEEIPPLGEELAAHLEAYRGEVRHASCSAWGLLYRVLRENGLPMGDVSFTEKGKPYFRDSGVYFSLSHSKALCAVAVSDRPVGVDAEICKPCYHPHLVERSLTELEKACFDGDFTRLWCRKEAIAKLTGEGITGYPNSIETTAYRFCERKISCGDREYWLAAAIQESER